MRKLILICFFSIIIALNSHTSYSEETKSENHYDEYEKFVKVVKIILDKYVDDVDLSDLFHNAYKGMLSGLDSYSQFFDAEDLEDLKIETEGEFEGLGIEVVIRNGMLMVITPIVDSPAMRAGILAGDIIVQIDGKMTDSMDLRNVIKELRGKPGTEITLTVIHKNEAETEDITIKRDKVRVNSIRGARLVDEEAKIGYLAITNFQDNTAKDLIKAIKKLKDLSMESLILDLRFNPGGLLKVAIDVADQFLEKGTIVSTKGKDESQNIVYKATKKGSLVKQSIVIIVNNGSASASEIVAGAIKDNKRGILLGTTTFGKGSVQSLLPVEDGRSALKLTTARYYTPSGASIHEKGIEPDILVDLTMQEIKELHENLALVNSENFQDVESNDTGENNSKVFVDKQLENAINILKGMDIIKK